MNKVLIVDESDYNGRTIADLLTKAGYIPVVMEDFDAAKEAVAKLPPGAVLVTAMKFNHGTELINRHKAEKYKWRYLSFKILKCNLLI